MKITGTHFNYFQVCKRKLWLFGSGIQMEHTSDLVAEGKLIHETTYMQRPSRWEELEIEGVKIDYYDPKERVIHEIKKTDKLEEAHEWQEKYYIWVLKQCGVEGVYGVLEYPRLRHSREVYLSTLDEEQIIEMKSMITNILEDPDCPPLATKAICRNCSYFDLCYAGEETPEL